MGRGVCRVLFWTLISTVLKESVGYYSGFHGYVGKMHMFLTAVKIKTYVKM